MCALVPRFTFCGIFPWLQSRKNKDFFQARSILHAPLYLEVIIFLNTMPNRYFFIIFLLLITTVKSKRIILFNRTRAVFSHGEINKTSLDHFLAKDFARYIFLTTGIYPTLEDVSDLPILDLHSRLHCVTEDTIFLTDSSVMTKLLPKFKNSSRKASSGQFTIYRSPSTHATAIVEEGERGLFYGVYSAIEQLGVRFGLHHDILPDPTAVGGLPLSEINTTTLKSLPFVAMKNVAPVFEYRGLQPFHDFLEVCHKKIYYRFNLPNHFIITFIVVKRGRILGILNNINMLLHN